MLEQIFMTIFVTSCIGAALTLFLTIFRPITRKCFSSRWHYYIWLVVLAVMIVPVSFRLPGKISHEDPVSTVVSRLSEMEIVVNVRNTEIDSRNFTYKVDFPAEEVYNSVETVRTMAVNKMDVISGIWIITAALLLAVKMLKYAAFLRKIRRDTKLISCPELKKFTDRKIHVRMSETICSPLMVGILRPTMILPKEALSAEQLDNVLAHEVTHFKRKDVWYKWFVGIVKCIHWFNPAVYIVEKQIDKECEISCDLEVVEKMSREQEISYVNTILSLLSLRKAKSIPLTTGMASCKKTLKERFMRIRNKKKISKTEAIISIVAAIAIFAGAIVVSGVLNGRYEEAAPGNNEIAVDKVTGDKSNLLFLGMNENEEICVKVLICFDREKKSIKGIMLPEEDFEIKSNEQEIIDVVKDKYSVPVNYYLKTDMAALTELAENIGEKIFGDSFPETKQKILRQFASYKYICPKDIDDEGKLHNSIESLLKKENIKDVLEMYKTLTANMTTNYNLNDLPSDARAFRDMSSFDIDFYSDESIIGVLVQQMR